MLGEGSLLKNALDFIDISCNNFVDKNSGMSAVTSGKSTDYARYF